MSKGMEPAGDGEAPQGPDVIQRISVAATGILAVVSTSATALAAVAGGGQRILVNEPVRTSAALLLLTVGAWLAFVVLLVFSRETGDARAAARAKRPWRIRTGLLAIAAALILIAVVAGIDAVVRTGSKTPQPSVTASIGEDMTLTGTVTSAEPDLDDRLFVTVAGYPCNPWTAQAACVPEVLLSGQVGPSDKGTVELPISVRIPPGRFEVVSLSAYEPRPGATAPPCRDATAELIGCVSLLLPRGEPLPDVSTSISGSGADRVASVHLAGVLDRPKRIGVRTDVETGGVTRSTRAFLVPQFSGRIDVESSVELGELAGRVCTVVWEVASTGLAIPHATPSEAACPSGIGDGSISSDIHFEAAAEP